MTASDTTTQQLPPRRRSRQGVELAVGVFLLLALAALLVLAFASTNRKLGFGGEQYELTAKFSNIADLRVHAPVKIAGVAIGEVAKISLDPKSYSAVVTLALDPPYTNMPADTNAKILTAGLLGERYVGLDPGGDPEALPSGSELIYTQSAVVLEELIGKYIFGAGGNKDTPSPGNPEAAADGEPSIKPVVPEALPTNAQEKHP
ncbi:MAG: outer membrane lipid asymmetry maintenance protein MlaD [Lysobacteraceae bacterium]